MGAAEQLDSRTKDQWKEYVNGDTIDQGFRVCRWGSCQYSSAQDFFDMYFRIRQDLNMEDTLDVLGCDVHWTKVRPLMHIKWDLLRDELSELAKALKERDTWWASCKYEFCSKIFSARSVGDLFKACRSQSWDLWSAADALVHIVLEGFRLKAPSAGGVGPILNMVAQNENYRTGLECALLHDLGLVKDEGSFAHFDT
jgi:hypothetical protein